jgi:uncharacterized protein (TIGR03437 family)
MRLAALLFSAALLAAQSTTFHSLHVSPEGAILDDSNKPVLLRGINRSATGSGNADASSTDADYAAQNQLLSMNLVRIFVNANWWNNKVPVPVANQDYQTYIDTLIQRAKKYGNYVLILMAAQFPDAPCSANGQNCPAPNQGDLNCQANANLCQFDSTGNNINPAFNFWNGFTARYAADPAILYDTWEDMHNIPAPQWSDNQNQLIAAIRTYAPQSLIFVEDTASAFEAIVAGQLPDLAWSNIVWNFHLFNASTSTCTEPASPRYASWPQNLDPLVAFATQNGHGTGIMEWGGCNDSDAYHVNITSYAQLHQMALAYFDNTNLITSTGSTYQLTATGTKVAQAYTVIAALGSAPAPLISAVENAFGNAPLIAPNTWVKVLGSNLTGGDTRSWATPDFVSAQLPTELDGVSVTVNGKNAYVEYVSPGQINILTPPDPMLGAVNVVVTYNGVVSATSVVQAAAISPSFFVFDGAHIVAQHLNYTDVGPVTLYLGLTTPAKPGEEIVLYANGFGPTSDAVVSGSEVQSGTLATMPLVKIGGNTASIIYAGLAFPGLYQFNVFVPSIAPDGDLPVMATYGGASTQAGVVVTVQH